MTSGKQRTLIETLLHPASHNPTILTCLHLTERAGPSTHSGHSTPGLQIGPHHGRSQTRPAASVSWRAPRAPAWRCCRTWGCSRPAHTACNAPGRPRRYSPSAQRCKSAAIRAAARARASAWPRGLLRDCKGRRVRSVRAASHRGGSVRCCVWGVPQRTGICMSMRTRSNSGEPKLRPLARAAAASLRRSRKSATPSSPAQGQGQGQRQHQHQRQGARLGFGFGLGFGLG